MRALLLSATLLSPCLALAEEAAPATEAPEASPIGLNVDVGVASAYLFRGLNVFAVEDQGDAHAFIAPSVTWTVGDTGLQIGYWGAYQLNGENRADAIDAGLGAETDLWLSWSKTFAPGLTAGAAFTWFGYPMADEDAAGVALPQYVEPALFATYASVVDLGLRLTYFHGVQDELELFRYAYVNPTVSKTFALSDAVSLTALGGFGYKRFNDDSVKDNEFDTLVTVSALVALPEGFYLKPAVSHAWTDFEERDAAESMAFVGSLNVGVNL